MGSGYRYPPPPAVLGFRAIAGVILPTRPREAGLPAAVETPCGAYDLPGSAITPTFGQQRGGRVSEAHAHGPSPLAELLAAARRKATEFAADPTRLLPTAPDQALLDELAVAVDELVEVVLVQQDLIENLLTRMSSLERTVHLPGSAGSAAGPGKAAG